MRKLLRNRRLEIGLRQADLAEKLAVYQSFVSKYESGERLLTFIETVDICMALDLDPNSLLREYLSYHDT